VGNQRKAVLLTSLDIYGIMDVDCVFSSDRYLGLCRASCSGR